MAVRATEAICIQTAPFGDTSQVIHWITRDFGRVACLAKGAFRLKNRYNGNEDLLTLSRITIFQRRGSGLGLLRERRLIETFPGLRSGLGRSAAGFLIVEMLRRTVQEGQVIRGLFDHLKDTLYALNDCGPERDIILFAFLGRLLRMLGFEPVLARCVLCERDAAGARKLFVSPRHGGVVCRSCRSDLNDGITISAAAAEVVRKAPQVDPTSLRGRRLAGAVNGEVWYFYELFLTHLLERELKSFAYARDHRNDH